MQAFNKLFADLIKARAEADPGEGGGGVFTCSARFSPLTSVISFFFFTQNGGRGKSGPSVPSPRSATGGL